MLQQIIILSALILGSITDLKKREVPDTLNYALIIVGLIIGITLTLTNNNFIYIINSVTGLAIAYAIGALFYYTGQWGGGDAKLIMGIGAITGINPLTITNTTPIFIIFIITSLIVGAIYGIIWLIILATKNKKEFKTNYKKIQETKPQNTNLKIIIITIAIMLIILFFTNIDKKIIMLSYSFLILLSLTIYSKNFLKAIEKTSLIKTIKIEKAVEGDWIIEEYKFEEKTIKSNKTGLSTEDIAYLKKKNIKEIKVKEGIPFVPSFLIAYIIITITGNWFLLL